MDETIYLGSQTKYTIAVGNHYLQAFKQHVRYLLDEVIITWKDRVYVCGSLTTFTSCANLVVSQLKSKRDFTGFMVSMPGVLWLTVFFLIPYIIIIIYSFLTSGIYGGVELPFTLEAYSKMLVNAGYWQILWRTVWISIIATSICVGLGLPAAYFIATSKHRNIFLTLVIIPFWTNFLVRIFGWMVILGRNGLINSFLQLLGLKEPLSFMYTPGAVILVIVYMYLPYMILPLYSAIEKFDFRLIEAAMDLGAKRARQFGKYSYLR